MSWSDYSREPSAQAGRLSYRPGYYGQEPELHTSRESAPGHRFFIEPSNADATDLGHQPSWWFASRELERSQESVASTSSARQPRRAPPPPPPQETAAAPNPHRYFIDGPVTSAPVSPLPSTTHGDHRYFLSVAKPNSSQHHSHSSPRASASPNREREHSVTEELEDDVADRHGRSPVRHFTQLLQMTSKQDLNDHDASGLEFRRISYDGVDPSSVNSTSLVGLGSPQQQHPYWSLPTGTGSDGHPRSPLSLFAEAAEPHAHFDFSSPVRPPPVPGQYESPPRDHPAAAAAAMSNSPMQRITRGFLERAAKRGGTGRDAFDVDVVVAPDGTVASGSAAFSYQPIGGAPRGPALLPVVGAAFTELEAKHRIAIVRAEAAAFPGVVGVVLLGIELQRWTAMEDTLRIEMIAEEASQRRLLISSFGVVRSTSEARPIDPPLQEDINKTHAALVATYKSTWSTVAPRWFYEVPRPSPATPAVDNTYFEVSRQQQNQRPVPPRDPQSLLFPRVVVPQRDEAVIKEEASPAKTVVLAPLPDENEDSAVTTVLEPDPWEASPQLSGGAFSSPPTNKVIRRGGNSRQAVLNALPAFEEDTPIADRVSFLKSPGPNARNKGAVLSQKVVHTVDQLLGDSEPGKPATDSHTAQPRVVRPTRRSSGGARKPESIAKSSPQSSGSVEEIVKKKSPQPPIRTPSPRTAAEDTDPLRADVEDEAADEDPFNTPSRPGTNIGGARSRLQDLAITSEGSSVARSATGTLRSRSSSLDSLSVSHEGSDGSGTETVDEVSNSRSGGMDTTTDGSPREVARDGGAFARQQ